MNTKLKNVLVRIGSFFWIFACLIGLIGGIGMTLTETEWVMGVCVLALGAAALPKVLSLKRVLTSSDSTTEVDSESETQSDAVADAESDTGTTSETDSEAE